MATFRQLLPETRMSIARQISERLPLSRDFVAPGAAMLGESLPILLLTADVIARKDLPLMKFLVQTHQWHHQIYSAKGATRFARSKTTENGHALGELVSSSLPGRLASTFRYIDDNLHSDAVVSLLVVPAYLITGLFMEDAGRENIVVVERPDRLDKFTLNTPYDAEQFLDVLSGVSPISGVPDLPRGAPNATL